MQCNWKDLGHLSLVASKCQEHNSNFIHIIIKISHHSLAKAKITIDVPRSSAGQGIGY